MSKLYNRLEQIRKNEAARQATGSAVSSAKQPFAGQWKNSIVLLVVVGGLSVLLYLSLPRIVTFISDIRPQETEQDSTGRHLISAGADNIPPSPLPQPSASEQIADMQFSMEAERNLIVLNNQGVAAVRKFDYWKGLHYLNRARNLQPERIEPLINMGVALTELGHNELAASFFKEAFQSDPEHPLLLANLAILKKTGIMETSSLPIATSNDE